MKDYKTNNCEQCKDIFAHVISEEDMKVWKDNACPKGLNGDSLCPIVIASTVRSCDNCAYYEEDFLEEENHMENYCKATEECCFHQKKNCGHFLPKPGLSSGSDSSAPDDSWC